jgi:protein-S-isoprenylcysteine O-methyltransferase Ste14
MNDEQAIRDVIALWHRAVLAMFYLRVVLFEEPWLARTHGDQWLRYRASLPRWLF